MAEDGFMSRWARRKNAAASGAPEIDPEEIAEAAAEQRAAEQLEADAAAQRAEEIARANREAAEAIDLETADLSTDFTPFLKTGVPAALRQVALRKLWRLDPVFACVDGLNDYDGDFTGANDVVKEITTRWQVGKGYAKAKDLLEEGESEVADGATEIGADAVEEVADNPSTLRLDPPRETPLPKASDEEDQAAEAETLAEVDLEPEERPRVSLRSRVVMDDWDKA